MPIKVLVVTNNFEYWIEKWNETFKIKSENKQDFGCRTLKNDFCILELRREIKRGTTTGKTYTACILDRVLDDEEKDIIENLMNLSKGITRTFNYYFK